MRKRVQRGATEVLGLALLCLSVVTVPAQTMRNALTILPVQGPQRSSAQLAREVKHELLLLPYYSVFDWLEFEVQDNGTVILRGQVTSPPDTKSNAEARVKDVEGVSRVINNIEVLPVSPSDVRLRRALYRAIYSGPLFRYQVGSLQSIHIIVNRGRATLKGWVSNEGDKNIAYIRARGVPGLFEVKNELRAESSEPR